jgi:cell division protein FtsA
MQSLAPDEAMLELPHISGKEARKVQKKELAMIIESRLVEILQMAAETLAEMGIKEPLPAGVVLTGGVSLTEGLPDLAEQIFQSAVRAAQPGYVGVKSPIYSTAVGIIHYIQHTQLHNLREYRGRRMELPGFFSRVKNWFLEMFD